MTTPLDPAGLAALATNRSQSLFADDMATRSVQIAEAVEGRRVLMIGAAGSIGSATARTLVPFAPAHLHIVDHDENGLADLVRDLRSSRDALAQTELRTMPLDYGSAVMRRFLDDESPYDLVLNFAALKHVRSEKDVYSLTQLLDTNVARQARFLDWLAGSGAATRYFCVSTDKAADPVNLMGASKRLMEHVVFSGIRPLPAGSVVTSARFANVAFSAGSLLESFLRRIERRQPLAVPVGVRRYFVSLEEAGQICLIAATAFPDCHTAIPLLTADEHLRPLEEIAVAIVERCGWTPVLVDDAMAAYTAMDRHAETGRYPVLLTPLDTSGEKPFEKFIGDDEWVRDVGLLNLGAIPYRGGPVERLREGVVRLDALANGEWRPDKSEVVEWVRGLLGDFEHHETGRDLDQRM